MTTVAGGKDDVHAPNLPIDDPKPSAEGKLILMMMFIKDVGGHALLSAAALSCLSQSVLNIFSCDDDD